MSTPSPLTDDADDPDGGAARPGTSDPGPPVPAPATLPPQAAPRRLLGAGAAVALAVVVLVAAVLVARRWQVSAPHPAAALPPAARQSDPPPPSTQTVSLAATEQPGGTRTGPPLPELPAGSLSLPALKDQQLRQGLSDAAGMLLERAGDPQPSLQLRHAIARILGQAAQLPGDEPWREQLRDLYERLGDTEGAAAPSWASASGVDGWGRWAEVQRGGYQQRFRWCPVGGFTYLLEDGAAHRVRLSHGFWLADHETTVGQYLLVRHQHGTAAAAPVSEVSWVEAEGFCLDLHALGLEARLPSEAEWELACRAGQAAAAAGPGSAAATPGGALQTTPVPAANPWGLCEMSGAAGEWCSDVYAPWTATAPDSAECDPTGPLEGPLRVVRGGAPGGEPESGSEPTAPGPDLTLNLKEARWGCTPSSRLPALGFRVAVPP